jgi:hypothetical protein
MGVGVGAIYAKHNRTNELQCLLFMITTYRIDHAARTHLRYRSPQL